MGKMRMLRKPIQRASHDRNIVK